MLYWLPATGASSARLYWESIRQVNDWIAGRTQDTVAVPTGCSIFPKELQRPSRRWAETRFTDIRYWNELDKGGHFAAFEQPELFVDEVRNFFRRFDDVTDRQRLDDPQSCLRRFLRCPASMAVDTSDREKAWRWIRFLTEAVPDRRAGKRTTTVRCASTWRRALAHSSPPTTRMSTRR